MQPDGGEREDAWIRDGIYTTLRPTFILGPLWHVTPFSIPVFPELQLIVIFHLNQE